MKIAFIGCSKTKVRYKTRAKNLYKGQLFTGYYKIAKKQCDKVYILSAKYGLLNENDIIEPYEYSLYKRTKYEQKLWSYYICNSLKNLLKEEDIIYWFCGKIYKQYISQKLKNKQIHFSEGKTIGYILKQIKNEIPCNF